MMHPYILLLARLTARSRERRLGAKKKKKLEHAIASADTIGEESERERERDAFEILFGKLIHTQRIVRSKTLAWVALIGVLCQVNAQQQQQQQLPAVDSGSSRWSRQTTNSEWIPLPHPRNGQLLNQQQQQKPTPIAGPVPPPPFRTHATNNDNNPQAAGQVPVVSLPPVLQQQYHDQIHQLQQTQDSIQRLLVLQQQLKAQQNILNSNAYQPNAYSNPEQQKQALHQSTITNVQTLPSLAPEVLVPPVPSNQALPPVFQAQNFHHQHHTQQPKYKPVLSNGQINQGQHLQQHLQLPQQQQQQVFRQNLQEVSSFPRKEIPKEFPLKQQQQQQKPKIIKDEPSRFNYVTPASAQVGADQQEVQLVYVPAETLAQRGQAKLKQQAQQSSTKNLNPYRQHHEEVSVTPASPTYDAYAREILYQLQKQHEQQNAYQNFGRDKEQGRQEVVDREVENQDRLRQEVGRKEQEVARQQQEAARKEQDAMRQREAEKKRKHLQEIEEQQRQRDIESLRDAREKQRQEMRKLVAAKNKDEHDARNKHDRFSAYNKRKEASSAAKLRDQTQQSQSQNYEVQQHPNTFPQQQQFHHQHLTEVTHKNVNSVPKYKPLPTANSYSQPQAQDYYNRQQQQQMQVVETTTALPPPNQPPLSVYTNLGHHHAQVKVTDVVRALKNARSIAVLDTFGPDTPKVFIGPRNLDPPQGYAKFDLPYLSSIENNRVERNIDKLPFFVAPMSYERPGCEQDTVPGAAHRLGDRQLAGELRSQGDPDQSSSASVARDRAQLVSGHTPASSSVYATESTTPSYETSASPVFRYETSSPTPRYESSTLPPSQLTTKWRFRDYGAEKATTEAPPAFVTTSYRDDARTSSGKYNDRPSKAKSNYYSQNEVSTTPNYYNSHPKTVSSFAYETVPSTTPAYDTVEPQRQKNVVNHLFEQTFGYNRQQQQNRYQEPQQVDYQHTNQRYPVDPVGHSVSPTYYPTQTPSYDDQSQYNLPADLPAISPQLPGLVNALVEKPGQIGSSVLPAVSTIPTTIPTTTTTTTTTEAPTTVQRNRSRQRGRVTASRATTTTQSPQSYRGGNAERPTRRPVNRSRSRFTTTTTEQYQEVNDNSQNSYEPTRRNPSTTPKYEEQQDSGKGLRKTTPKSSFNFRFGEYEQEDERDDGLRRSTTPRSQLYQREQLETESIPTKFIEKQREQVNQQQVSIDEVSVSNPSYQQDDYSTVSTASPTPTEVTYQQQQYNVGSQGIGADSLLPLAGLEYTSRKVTLAPQVYSSSSAAYDDTPSTVTEHYRYSTTRDYPYYSSSTAGRTESPVYETVPTTDLPREQYSPVYQSSHEATPRPIYRDEQQVEEEQPIYQPIPQDKQEDYTYQTTEAEQIAEVSGATIVCLCLVLLLSLAMRYYTVDHYPNYDNNDHHHHYNDGSTNDGNPSEGTRSLRRPPGPTRAAGGHHSDETARRRERVRALQRGESGPRSGPRQTHVVVRSGGGSSTRQRSTASETAPAGDGRRSDRGPGVREHPFVVVVVVVAHRYTTTTTPSPATFTPTTTAASSEEQQQQRGGLESTEDVAQDYGFIKNHKPNYKLSANAKPSSSQSSQSVESNESSSSGVASNENSNSNSPQSQILKNRSKYLNAARRQPGSFAGRSTTTTANASPSTTTPRSSEESTTRRVYLRQRQPQLANSANANEEAVRQGKTQRPRLRKGGIGGRRRVSTTTTTSTEASVEDTNELPQGQDNADDSRYPQDFVLNYGATQSFHRDDYDQAQLASDSARSRSQHSRSRTSPGRHSDIYGSESQWSTKFNGNSYQQPNSFDANEEKPSSSVDAEKAGGTLPENSGSDDSSSNSSTSASTEETTNLTSSEESAKKTLSSMTEDFGKKQTENGTQEEEIKEPAQGTEVSSTPEGSTSTSTTTESTSTTTAKALYGKYSGKKGTQRRKRLRSRPKPTPNTRHLQTSTLIDESIVSIGSTEFRNFYVSTRQPYWRPRGTAPPSTTTTQSTTPSTSTTVTTTTTTTEAPTTEEKSAFESFLDKMLGESEDEATMTTEVPSTEPSSSTTPSSTSMSPEDIWTMAAATDMPFDEDTMTTLSEQSYNNNDDNDDERSGYTTINDDGTEMPTTVYVAPTTTAKPSTTQSTTTTTTTTTTPKPTTQEDDDSKSVENSVSSISQENSLNFFANKSPAPQGVSAIEESRRRRPSQESRSKWSEVRYPTDKSLFKWNPKSNQTGSSTEENSSSQSTEQKPDNNQVSDYVQAIFESIKSADQEPQAAKPYQSSRQEKELLTEPLTVFKTSVSSSSRVVAGQPQVVSFSQLRDAKTKGTSGSARTVTFGPFVPSLGVDKLSGIPTKKVPSSLDAKSLKNVDAAATKADQMTEICYRGRCVMKGAR
ncbi:unnamed protein product [Trichogramma brassicae]|uniref:Uncharacterized protein n=1 Tax=Trichogramma brassicae TaxID=86971 RepID=A0A6H5IND1_9HYME|nr:unnamed protein product [Trichogramma brassicae]